VPTKSAALQRNIQASDEILFLNCFVFERRCRSAYNTLERAARSAIRQRDAHSPITPELREECWQRKLLRYDKPAKKHFNLFPRCTSRCAIPIPRGAILGSRSCSNPEKSLYLRAPHVRHGPRRYRPWPSPGALAVTLAARTLSNFLGAPEGHLALRKPPCSFSLAPNPSAVHRIGEVLEDVQKTEAAPVQAALAQRAHRLAEKPATAKATNTPTTTKKNHRHAVPPRHLAGRAYYQPTDQGFEQRLRQRLDEFLRSVSYRSTP